jgi:thymidine phosphorylase
LLESQWSIARSFFVALLRNSFPEQSETAVGEFADAARESGQLLTAFNALLCAHGVESRVADALCTDPLGFYFQCLPTVVSSSIEGRIIEIDQKQLGYYVNFLLGGGGNEYGGRRNLRAGCILQIRTGQRVNIGSPLALVYSNESVSSAEDASEKIRACIKIGA